MIPWLVVMNGLLLLACLGVAQTQCGLKNGFKRPPLQKAAAEKCEQAAFLEKIGSVYTSWGLPADESCEITTFGNNPNCVQSKGFKRLDKPQCLINFEGKTVKIINVATVDDADFAGVQLGINAFETLGCTPNGDKDLIGFKGPGAANGKVIKDYLNFAADEAPAWRVCFEESNQSPEPCTLVNT